MAHPRQHAPRDSRRPPSHPPARQGRYINRELSSLEFNRRVLEEALDDTHPLLERVKFLSIFGSNLDEFFMVRVSGLRRQMAAVAAEPSPDGLTAAEQLAAIRERLLPLLERCAACWQQDLRPRLEEAGIHVLSHAELRPEQQALMRQQFQQDIFPVLTPLAFDPGHPFPHISNLSLNLAVSVRDPAHGERFARLKCPVTFPRLLRIPDENAVDDPQRLGLAEARTAHFVWLEEVIAANVDLLFPGLEILATHPFRVTRDADLEIEEDEAADLLTAITEVVEQRHFGSVVRLQIDRSMPERIQNILVRNLELAPYQVYTSDEPLGYADLHQLTSLDRPQLKHPPFHPVPPPQATQDEGTFSVIRRSDLVVHHPYDSFTSVTQFLSEAARDPDVVAIKQTLYRVGPNSPIVALLKEARENGKQVAALVELKARFDEENNIVWARALEEAGVHVVYGVMGLKTHAKMSMVVRRESDGIRRYLHLATGNYNPVTARLYTDLGYFTCERELGQDVADLFNALTGYSRKTEYRRLLVAPGTMRELFLERIDREIASHREHGGGHIAFKMNSLSDERTIDALYRASQAGVRVDLVVRGICCLRPGVPGLSENVTVKSIVGRFLEHSRLYWFRNGGREEMLTGSADLMPRNFDNRVEVLFPVGDPELRAALRDDLLFVALADNRKAWQLKADGAYVRAEPRDDEPPLSSQEHFMTHGGRWRRFD